METKQIKLDDEFDENDFGDKFIREARLSREQELKLKLIDSQLERLKMTSSRGDCSDPSRSSSTRDSESTVSLISHDQLRLLLSECYTENTNLSHVNFNGKLDTLKEEDSFVSESQALEIESSLMRPCLNQELLSSLLEQAKCEGIMALANGESNGAPDTDRSFYEEALEIIAARPAIEDFFRKDYDDHDDQAVPCDPELKLVNEPSESYFLNGNKTRLPPIGGKSSEDFRQETNDFRGEMGSRQSTSSSIGSSSILPKIDNRYLPKN